MVMRIGMWRDIEGRIQKREPRNYGLSVMQSKILQTIDRELTDPSLQVIKISYNTLLHASIFVIYPSSTPNTPILTSHALDPITITMGKITQTF